MYKIDSLYSVDGHFNDGDYRTGRKGTRVPALWLNALQSEICNYILNSGIDLDKEDNSQLLKALNKNLEKDLQRQTISGNTQHIDPAALIIAEFSVTSGGVVDFTAFVTIPGSVNQVNVALKILNSDTSFVYKTVYFQSRADDSKSRRRICLKNDSDSPVTYQVTVNCLENVFIAGNVDLSGWADYE